MPLYNGNGGSIPSQGFMDDIKTEFDHARMTYPGTKRGLDTEYAEIKRHKDYKEIVPKLVSIIVRQIEYYKWLKNNNKFCPPWKHFRTWIHNRCWEDEFPDFDAYHASRNPFKHNSSPASAKSQEIKPIDIKIATPEERRRIAEEHDWKVRLAKEAIYKGHLKNAVKEVGRYGKLKFGILTPTYVRTYSVLLMR
jgi:hypothetical protein